MKEVASALFYIIRILWESQRERECLLVRNLIDDIICRNKLQLSPQYIYLSHQSNIGRGGYMKWENLGFLYDILIRYEEILRVRIRQVAANKINILFRLHISPTTCPNKTGMYVGGRIAHRRADYRKWFMPPIKIPILLIKNRPWVIDCCIYSSRI